MPATALVASYGLCDVPSDESCAKRSGDDAVSAMTVSTFTPAAWHSAESSSR
jgi:hypothetical protein